MTGLPAARHTESTMRMGDRRNRLGRVFRTPLAVGEVFRGNGLGPAQWVSLTFWVIAAYLCIVLFTFSDYGITYDEQWHSTYGRHILRWYRSLFQDTGALGYWNMSNYGGFFDVIAEAAAYVSPMGAFETRHLITALFALLAVVGTSNLARRFGGASAGLLAALFLILTPRFFGHGFVNPKDIPFAVTSLFAVYYTVEAIHRFPGVPKRLVLKLGLVIGCAMGIRIGGVLALGYLAAAMVLWVVGRLVLRRRERQAPAGEGIWRTVGTLAGRFAAVGAVAYVVMLVWWPAAQVHPISTPLRALMHSAQFPYSFDVLFDGRLISNMELPWYYVPKWIGITSPAFLLIGILAGMVAMGVTLWRVIRRTQAVDLEAAVGLAVVLLATTFPIVYTMATRPTNYDGVRHFLFVFPLMSVLGSVAVVKLIAWSRSRAVGAVILGATATSMGITVVDLVALHPYQYVYFNRLVAGGVPGAAGSYELDYWGSSSKEGVEWLVENYPTGKGRAKVASCLHATSTEYYLPENRFQYIGAVHDGHPIPEGEEPELFLAHPRWGCAGRYPGHVLHTVAVKGVPLLYVVEVSRPEMLLAAPDGEHL